MRCSGSTKTTSGTLEQIRSLASSPMLKRHRNIRKEHQLALEELQRQAEQSRKVAEAEAAVYSVERRQN